MKYPSIVQLTEQPILNRELTGESPVRGTIFPSSSAKERSLFKWEVVGSSPTLGAIFPPDT